MLAAMKQIAAEIGPAVRPGRDEGSLVVGDNTEDGKDNGIIRP
eukprot:SAG31_NODE_35359_length_324_cov_0.622222_1_plen_42_part_10